MPKRKKNEDEVTDFFPRINIPFLKLFVKYDMLKIFTGLSLQKVILYRYNPKHYRHYEYIPKKFTRPKKPKYVLAFLSDVNLDKLDDNQKDKIKSLYRTGTYFLTAEDIGDEEDISIDEPRIQTMPDEHDFYYWNMTQLHFKEVYKEKQEGNYLEEWMCILIVPNKKKLAEDEMLKLPYSEMPPWVSIDAPHEILYQRGNKNAKTYKERAIKEVCFEVCTCETR
jgi:hypothetical protein